MKKLLQFILLSISILYAGDVFAQRRNNSFQITPDMERRITRSCPRRLARANVNRENLQPFCPVRNIRETEADLGPWRAFVYRTERLFKQFRTLLYVGAIFMLMWLFTKAVYKSTIDWPKVAMLLIGVLMLTLAEVFLDVATQRVRLDDVIAEGVYVDCRDPTEAYYKCDIGKNDAEQLDAQYFLKVSGTQQSQRKHKGLF